MSHWTEQYNAGLMNQSLEERARSQQDLMRALSKEELDAIIQEHISGMQNAWQPTYDPTTHLPLPRGIGVFASLKRFLNSLGAKAGLKTTSPGKSSSSPNESTNGGK